MVKVGLFVRMEAKPGKETEIENFLKGGLEFVNNEPATTAWFAVRLGPSTFGIFDVFPDDAGRQAHLTGALAKVQCPIASIGSDGPVNDAALMKAANPRILVGQTLGAGHFNQLEVPDQVNAMIEHFLRISLA